jgi:ornithine carbamoyltransferase
VVNALTNHFHPCQVLADLQTVRQRLGHTQGRTLTYVGDAANNMAYTWLQAARVLGFRVNVSTPPTYALDARLAPPGPHFTVFDDPMDAARGAHLVTTDVWTSMGFEAENEARAAAFADWQVDRDMMQVAAPEAVFMHCLPAHRGEEVTAEVLDGPQSVVWDEAENRLHVQKALMEYLLLGKNVR